jgi:hypothetical protein
MVFQRIERARKPGIKSIIGYRRRFCDMEVQGGTQQDEALTGSKQKVPVTKEEVCEMIQAEKQGGTPGLRAKVSVT